MLKLAHLVDDKITPVPSGPVGYPAPLGAKPNSAGSVSGNGSVGPGGLWGFIYPAGDINGQPDDDRTLENL